MASMVSYPRVHIKRKLREKLTELGYVVDDESNFGRLKIVPEANKLAFSNIMSFE